MSAKSLLLETIEIDPEEETKDSEEILEIDVNSEEEDHNLEESNLIDLMIVEEVLLEGTTTKGLPSGEDLPTEDPDQDQVII